MCGGVSLLLAWATLATSRRQNAVYSVYVRVRLRLRALEKVVSSRGAACSLPLVLKCSGVEVRYPFVMIHLPMAKRS